MLFNSASYLIFLPLVVVAYWLMQPRWRTPLLLVASYIFYMVWKPAYGLLILGLTIFNYFLALRISETDTKDKKLLLVLTVSANLLTLAFFKYAVFLHDLANAAFHLLAPSTAALPALPMQIILPLGISFFVFEFIHYAVEVFRGGQPVKSFVDFALFASFFPTQIAGPIKRYQDFIPQLSQKHRFTLRHLDEGVELILFGLFKKVIFADNLSVSVQACFEHPQALTGVDAWLAAYAFAFQIYFDFSGYSDIARGSARLLGFKVPPNFSLPYLSASITDFWRRWHISLSLWLRDYLFIPMGGSKSAKLLTYRNLFLTMLLGGIWHGAGIPFIIWGAYQGLLLMLNKEWRAFCQRIPVMERVMASRPAHLISIVLTFHAVCVGWIFFRAETTTKAMRMLSKMFQLFNPGSADALINWHLSLPMTEREPVFALLPLMLVVIFLGQIVSATFKGKPGLLPLSRKLRPLRAVYLACLAALLIVYSPEITPRFIYFQF